MFVKDDILRSLDRWNFSTCFYPIKPCSLAKNRAFYRTSGFAMHPIREEYFAGAPTIKKI